MAKKNKKDKKKTFPKANMVQLGSKPPKGRLIWISVSEKDGKRILGCGVTHEGLRKALARDKDIKEIKIVDVKKDKIIDITEGIELFLVEWKENYFNPKWGYKKIEKAMEVPF